MLSNKRLARYAIERLVKRDACDVTRSPANENQPIFPEDMMIYPEHYQDFWDWKIDNILMQKDYNIGDKNVVNEWWEYSDSKRNDPGREIEQDYDMIGLEDPLKKRNTI